MMDWLQGSYDWLRALHIILVIAWMAGMLIYPRLLVYRLEAQGNAGYEAAMDAAARRTRLVIVNPAMIVVWVLGLALLATSWEYYLGQPWMHAKLTLVLLLSAYHGWMIGLGRKIARGERPIEPRRLRMLNEIPFLIAIAAVIMVVVQPFAR